MILLTSDGLSSKNLISEVSDIVQEHDFKTAVLVVNANKRYRKKHVEWETNIAQLKECGLKTVLFDLDHDDHKILRNADVIFLGGGSPFYLLLKLKEYDLEGFLHKTHEFGKLIIGVSGGSLVLQETLSLIDVFAPDMKLRHGGDLIGIGLVSKEFLPHAGRYERDFDNFRARLNAYEEDNGIKAILLDDGDGLFYEKDYKLIRK